MILLYPAIACAGYLAIGIVFMLVMNIYSLCRGGGFCGLRPNAGFVVAWIVLVPLMIYSKFTDKGPFGFEGARGESIEKPKPLEPQMIREGTSEHDPNYPKLRYPRPLRTEEERDEHE